MISITAALMLATFSIIQNQTYDFDLAEGAPAQASLVAWSSQVGIQSLFDYRVMNGNFTHAVKGRYTGARALALMIEGTTIRYSWVSDHTVAFFESQVYCRPELGSSAPLPPCARKTQ